MDAGIFIINNTAQLKLEDGDLVADEGLQNAVLISVFSDQRVAEGELPQGERNPRGWWGDEFAEVEGDKIGSKLWLQDRSKQTLESLVLIENHVKASLQWLIDDGVAKEVTATADFDERGRNTLAISITRPDGKNTRFDIFWDKQQLKVYS